MDILKKMYIGMLLVLLAACGGSDQQSNARQAPVQNQPAPANAPIIPSTPNAATTPTAPVTAEPAQNAAGIWHYTCPNGHAGGAGSATTCAECGTTLAHNSAYHGNAATPNPAAAGAVAPVAGGTPATMFADPSKTPVNTTIGAAPVAPTQAPEPAQNAAGVWHYTCPSGCAGGGGSATACSSCGATLAHNQAYH